MCEHMTKMKDSKNKTDNPKLNPKLGAVVEKILKKDLELLKRLAK